MIGVPVEAYSDPENFSCIVDSAPVRYLALPSIWLHMCRCLGVEFHWSAEGSMFVSGTKVWEYGFRLKVAVASARGREEGELVHFCDVLFAVFCSTIRNMPAVPVDYSKHCRVR